MIRFSSHVSKPYLLEPPKIRLSHLSMDQHEIGRIWTAKNLEREQVREREREREREKERERERAREIERQRESMSMPAQKVKARNNM